MRQTGRRPRKWRRSRISSSTTLFGCGSPRCRGRRQIAEFALYDGDPTLVNHELDELLAVTPDQIRHAVGTYLNTDNRALLDVVPAGKGIRMTRYQTFENRLRHRLPPVAFDIPRLFRRVKLDNGLRSLWCSRTTSAARQLSAWHFNPGISTIRRARPASLGDGVDADRGHGRTIRAVSLPRRSSDSGASISGPRVGRFYDRFGVGVSLYGLGVLESVAEIVLRPTFPGK